MLGRKAKGEVNLHRSVHMPQQVIRTNFFHVVDVKIYEIHTTVRPY